MKKKTKARKPDAAERIAAADYPIDRWSTGEEEQYASIMRRSLAARIRRAINAATVAERKRITGYIDTRQCNTLNSLVKAVCGDLLSDIENGAKPLPRAAKESRR